MQIFFIALDTIHGRGLMVDSKKLGIVCADTLSEALTVIKYEGTPSDTIHWLDFRPLVIKISGDSEEDCRDKLYELLDLSEGTQGKLVRLVSTAGTMEMMRFKQGLDLEPFIVERYSSLSKV